MQREEKRSFLYIKSPFPPGLIVCSRARSGNGQIGLCPKMRYLPLCPTSSFTLLFESLKADLPHLLIRGFFDMDSVSYNVVSTLLQKATTDCCLK
jgi:hypothetical protein